MSPINRPECRQWMIKMIKCRDLLGSNAPNNYDTPAFYKDVDLMTPEGCHKLKRKLDWEREVPDMDRLVQVVAAILAVAVIVVLLVLFICEVKWRPKTKTDSIGQEPIHQKGPPETPQKKRKKKLNFKKWVRGSFRSCFVQTEKQARGHQIKAKKKVAVHKEHSQRKLAEWTKAREQNEQKKKEKLERRNANEYDRRQKSVRKG